MELSETMHKLKGPADEGAIHGVTVGDDNQGRNLALAAYEQEVEGSVSGNIAHSPLPWCHLAWNQGRQTPASALATGSALIFASAPAFTSAVTSAWMRADVFHQGCRASVNSSQ